MGCTHFPVPPSASLPGSHDRAGQETSLQPLAPQAPKCLSSNLKSVTAGLEVNRSCLAPSPTHAQSMRRQVPHLGVGGFLPRRTHPASTGHGPCLPVARDSPRLSRGQQPSALFSWYAIQSSGRNRSPDSSALGQPPPALGAYSLASQTCTATRRARPPAACGLVQWLSNLSAQREQPGLWGTNAHSGTWTQEVLQPHVEKCQHFPWHSYSNSNVLQRSVSHSTC